MKTAAKIIAYCVWFGIVFFMSVYHFWPLEVNLKIWRAGSVTETRGSTAAIILFWISLSILWLGFIFVLSWLPIWLIKKKKLSSAKLLARFAAFLLMTLICLILSAVIWQLYFLERIYNCTDDNFLGFLRPGDWIHGDYATVPKVVPSLSMSEPDTIKQRWSVFKLWCVWWAFIFISVAISAALTFLIFRSRKKISS